MEIIFSKFPRGSKTIYIPGPTWFLVQKVSEYDQICPPENESVWMAQHYMLAW